MKVLFIIMQELYIKFFNKNILNSYLRINSKIEKINFIHNNCFGFKIAYPEKLVFNAKNEFLGYTMQYINKKVDLYSFLLTIIQG